MFVDEITITAKAGKGGDGVTRWRQEKFRPKAGPAGGNGGRGGNVVLRAVRDMTVLARLRGVTNLHAENAEDGRKNSQFGHKGDDLIIPVPINCTITDISRGREYHTEKEGEEIVILKGGAGGLGNEYFKSSTNTAPQQHTKGKPGERGDFHISLQLIAEVGLIGLPNAGKTSLLNALTSSKGKVGSYPFTTIEPSLGSFFGYVIADIPGLIEGAAHGKGLGHKFLRHVRRTGLLLHVIGLDDSDPLTSYRTVHNELKEFDAEMLNKKEWIVLNKCDLTTEESLKSVQKNFEQFTTEISIVSTKTGEGIDKLQAKLSKFLQK